MKFWKSLLFALALVSFQAFGQAKLSPLFNEATLDDAGNPASGWKIWTYVAGSSTPATTYTSEAASTPQSNPIVANSRGEVASPIWLTEGVSYKFVLTDENDVVKRTIDNVDGINDASISLDQWVAGPEPTYVSATSFTLVGDQTSDFHIGRALKLTDSGGTNYTHISNVAFTTVTTVTIPDSVLDSGLSVVSLGLVTATNSSLPSVIDFDFTHNGNVTRTGDLAQTGNQSITGNITVVSTDAGAGAGPVHTLRRNSATPAANDTGGAYVFNANDSALNSTSFASIVGVSVDPTDGTEDGNIVFNTVVNGTFAERIRFGAGFFTTSAAGGDMGAGTSNVEVAYQNGIRTPIGAIVYIREQQTSGTHGGTFTSGDWRTRVLTTEVTDSASLATLASNQITLAAGTYDIIARSPASAVNAHKAKLRNVTAGADILLGSTANASSGDTTMTDSWIRGRFTVAASQALEIQHQCTTTNADDGFGVAASFGTEIYTEVWLTRIQ